MAPPSARHLLPATSLAKMFPSTTTSYGGVLLDPSLSVMCFLSPLRQLVSITRTSLQTTATSLLPNPGLPAVFLRGGSPSASSSRRSPTTLTTLG